MLVVVLAASCSAAAKSPTRAALVGANTPPRSCVSGWSIAAKPYTAGVLADDLVAESAASYDDVWAVGIRFLSPVRTGALIEHWDGRRWRVVPGADLGGRRATLAAVAAVTSDNVWAVGTLIGTTTAGLRQQGPLIEHWNGRHWSLVTGAPFPLAAVKEPEGLDGIAAAGPDDIWMHGLGSSSGVSASISRDLYEHWDGRRWSLFEGPVAVSSAVGLAATQVISADAAGYVWAAGGKIRGFGEAGKPAGSLVERWNGSRWVETTPPAGRYAVGALAVVAPNDVWAVTGSALATGAGGYGYSGSPRFVHWNGTAWAASAHADGVVRMVAKGPNDVWAVGVTTAGRRPLVEHWDGQRWQRVDTRPPVPVPSPDSQIAGLASLSIAPDGAVVAFTSDSPRLNGDKPESPPAQARNYLWIRCP